MPGVVAAFGRHDLEVLAKPMQAMNRDPGIEERTLCPLTEEVRFDGEAVAVIVADEPYRAEDAVHGAEAQIVYDGLPPVVDPADTMDAGAPRVHGDVPGNVAGRFSYSIGDIDAAFHERIDATKSGPTPGEKPELPPPLLPRGRSGPALVRELSRTRRIAGHSTEVTMTSQSKPWLMRETRRHWPLMTAYERFEHVVAFMLSMIIAMLIALALVQLFVRVVPLLATGALDALDHEVFQGLFGMVMTLLMRWSSSTPSCVWQCGARASCR